MRSVINMPNEQRKYKRYTGYFSVSYSILSGLGATPFEFGKCQTLDISRSGARLLLDDCVETPIMIQLNIRIPNRDYGVFVLGKALYCHDSSFGNEDGNLAYEAGVKFVGLLPPDFEQLLNSIAKH